ncbi:MAG: hypothetical protein HND58_13180 [Planctomycetota bacterium]|nr:MAG: hypothetical protein HND58_13180 [Planctomycetota bacterium]
MRRSVFGGAVVCLLCGAASADLINADIENNASDVFGAIDGWGPNGGWADHASFAKPNNDSLGEAFGFYSVFNDETVGQVTDMVFTNGASYTFSSWGMGGGNDVGTMVYEIGFDDGSGAFVMLAQATYDVGGSWEQLDGVSYTPSDGDGAAGQAVWVRLGSGSGPAPEDVWFDSFSLVPAPGVPALLGVGLLAGLRRRR